MNFQPHRTFIFQLGTSHFFYRDSYQYETKPAAQGGRGYAELLFLPTAEGYAKAVYSENLSEHEPAFYKYVYLYKDHLGNTRLSYTLNPRTGKVTILEENNYYPFGLKHGGYNTTKKEIKYNAQLAGSLEIQEVLPEAVKFKYKYNGKELQDELGLNWYDYGARNYQADLGRWFNVDPLSEEFYQWSPYHYALNNPVFIIDRDGRKGEDWFVNKKTGALVYIQGEHKLNKETANKAFGTTMTDVIFNNEKNDFNNWERLGDDTMFDTPNNKVSENGTDFKPESVAEDFANSKGFLKGTKTKVKIVNYVSYDNDGQGLRETESIRERIIDKGITYAKKNSIKHLWGTTKNHYGGRVEEDIEERVNISNSKSGNTKLYFHLGKEIIKLVNEVIKKY